MKLSSAIAGGAAGAIVLTLLHETIRRIDPDAPRMDLLGMQALRKSLSAMNVPVPDGDHLFRITMVGDVVSNSMYYALAAIGSDEKVLLRGGLLGLAAGVGAVLLPKPLGLNDKPSNRTTQTKLMTIALYVTGGLVASLTSRLLENNKS